MEHPDTPQLKQVLEGWQIFFIVISVVIGGGIFSNTGQALAIAGPGGLLICVGVVGVIAISVMECVSEFVQLFPAPNAVFEYVAAFVDEDLAWVVGIAYWYTFAAISAAQNLAAAGKTEISERTNYFGLKTSYQGIIFYAFVPFVLLGINLCGVFVFGWIETVGGALKILLILATSIFLFIVTPREHLSPSPFDHARDYNDALTTGWAGAIFYAIPLVAYSYIGVETVIVSAYEAKDSRALKWPSRTMAYIVFALYFLCTVAQALAVRYDNGHLYITYSSITGDILAAPANTSTPHSSSPPIIAAADAGITTFASFLNGCYLFSVLSASNTSLYIASRTLYGLARRSPKAHRVGRWFNKLSAINQRTGVPIRALFVSTAAFYWLPWLRFGGSSAVDYVTTVIATSGSVSALIVWASLCLAFIRYLVWLKRCEKGLPGEFPDLQRDGPQYKMMTLFFRLQPIPAYVGLCGSLMVIVVTSATWWRGPFTAAKLMASYGAPIILIGVFLIIKLVKFFNGARQRRWVKLDPDLGEFQKTIRRLRWYKRDEVQPRGGRVMFGDAQEDSDTPTSRSSEEEQLRSMEMVRLASTTS